MAGEQIGRYGVVGALGSGGMGVVYRCQDPAIGRDVAVKMIRRDIGDPDSTEHQRLQTQMRREAQAIGRLNHPHIAAIYDLLTFEGAEYIVMELVEGPSLEQRMRSGSTTLPESARMLLLKQIAEALDYAHSQGILHRDIKPANVLLRSDAFAKVTDFGIARLIAAETLTQTGGLSGTIRYMAPEQISGERLTPAVDQYALAVTAWELLVGTSPFRGEQPAQLMAEKLFTGFQPEPESAERLGSVRTEALRRALAIKPADRFASCTDFVLALNGSVPVSRAEDAPTVFLPGPVAPSEPAAKQPGGDLSSRVIEAVVSKAWIRWALIVAIALVVLEEVTDFFRGLFNGAAGH